MDQPSLYLFTLITDSPSWVPKMIYFSVVVTLVLIALFFLYDCFLVISFLYLYIDLPKGDYISTVSNEDRKRLRQKRIEEILPATKYLKRNCTMHAKNNRAQSPCYDDLGCVICMAEYEDGEDVIIDPKCKHIFHKTCLMEWLDKHDLCPMCRENMILR
mmetsp:Transcript_39333/g.59418  ORF Transcript_39333/g.59418 Transcript_39333/m.59418 type:complete len:159 (+) Transcript_39333:108-584(+)